MQLYRKVILLGLITCLMALPLSSQIFGINPKAGVNVSTLSGDFIFEGAGFDLTSDFKRRVGYVVGVSFRKSLLPLISLQSEILYTTRGANIEQQFTTVGPYLGVDFDGSIDLSYLEVPLLVRISLPLPFFSPAVYGGPAVAFNLDAVAKGRVTGNLLGDLDSVDQSFEEDIKDDIKNTDFSLVLGVGFEFGLPILKGTFDLRYTGGLRDILDNNGNGNLSLKNSTISAMIGVRF